MRGRIDFEKESVRFSDTIFNVVFVAIYKDNQCVDHLIYFHIYRLGGIADFVPEIHRCRFGNVIWKRSN